MLTYRGPTPVGFCTRFTVSKGKIKLRSIFMLSLSYKPFFCSKPSSYLVVVFHFGLAAIARNALKILFFPGNVPL